MLSLLPQGFAAYVRVFHPARRAADGGETPVRWGEIAEASGTRAGPGMQLWALTRGLEHRSAALPGVYDVPPDVGSLPYDLWPDDHAWCVATEIDLDTTYIGCTETCLASILADRHLEALRIDPTIGIDRHSDPLNVWPDE